MKPVYRFTLAIVLCELAGLVGALFVSPAMSWYATLHLPAFNPPNWLFAPVWIVLYASMGIALELLASHKASLGEKAQAYMWFWTQIILNMIWPAIFFGLHAQAVALIVLFALWIAILGTFFAFREISKPAAWLMVPYLLWTTFALVLNFAIWRVNGG